MSATTQSLARSKSNKVNALKTSTKSSNNQQKKQLSFKEPPKENYIKGVSLEHEFTKKFYAVVHGHSGTSFDAFFDYNMGFWVLRLDSYLTQINDHHDVLTHYIGLKWFYSAPINKMFYSLIIQSPASQKVFELMSFHKPDLASYPNLRHDFEFQEVNELRASFLSYAIHKGQYPWDRNDAADIVPIKISYGCSDISSHLEFYVNVLEATLLYQENDIISTLDGHSVSYAFLKPLNDKIEIEFVQRPIDYTYGSFTTQLYQNLLVNTHYDRITSPVCGLDRWFDNHYGYNTLKFAEDPLNYNYLDRVLDRLVERRMVWRLFVSEHGDIIAELLVTICSVVYNSNSFLVVYITYHNTLKKSS